MLLLDGASRKVDVCQCVQLGNADVNVAYANTCREYAHSLAFVVARNGVEFAVRCSALNSVKMLGDGLDACGVAYQNDDVGHLFG